MYILIIYFTLSKLSMRRRLEKIKLLDSLTLSKLSHPNLSPLPLLVPPPCSRCTTPTSWAAGTTTRTGCTRRRPTATTTNPTWTRWSPSHPWPTTALSRTASNPPPTTWTFTPACGGLRTGRSRTRARPTPGCRGRGGRRLQGRGAGPPRARCQEAQDELFHELWLYMSVFVVQWMCACVCVRVSREEFSWAMADGKMERVPKKEIKECCFFPYCFSRRRWNLAWGRGFLFCFLLFSWTIADDGVKKKRHTALSRC